MSNHVTFDGSAKTITVSAGVAALDIQTQVYTDWVNWVPANAQFLPAMRFAGHDVIPGGETGGTYFLTNGWKLVYDPTITVISGILYSDDFATAYWTQGGSPLYPASVSAISLSSGGGGNDTAEIASLTAMTTLILRRLGLDKTAPLTSRPDGSISATDIDIVAVPDGENIVQTRQ